MSFMNYLKGTGTNRALQNVADYGLGAAIGAGGQQLANWVLPGADPNPLVSGLLAAPLGAAALRGSRGVGSIAFGRGESALSNTASLATQLSNPYEKAALAGSTAAAIGSGATSLYNSAQGLANGDIVDNNIVGGGLATLGALAPMTLSLINRNRGGTGVSGTIT